ncbi:NADP-dependent glyceraldehyde-3-phosphate dehydrogenase [Desulfobacula toluolica]|uniref:GapN: NADP-dependent glycerinaldehyde-3-phsophate dehydrogenase n=1 Tax=Desulfobacula toluolica (strain DSM 7467 / Tol2) TaxID=651182 RepID=K0NPA7_DESTT|nr:NADP-dependent glyceraldehyde-3-phosphate dehydrogenase [Desulfobacula toluolica]CCK80637.1 GapN: NADP-dependent glycerinaldehyde-3-phsophate dehydrogenase [Desulfobacula toluolica Tol2]
MMLNEKIQKIFPRFADIPEILLKDIPCIQTGYLLNGEIHSWDGPRQEVFSPVWLADDTGQAPFFIGEYPLLTETEAFQALDAAVDAYDHGRGMWPTLSVAERIDHMERFIFRMIEVKDRVVRFLMWEVGKSLQDSEKEFDRTIKYINDTLEALKDLDRISSSFTIEEDIIGQIRRAPMGVVLCMGPFNYPLNETFTTLIPALVMGNTVILKPPKHGALLYAPLLAAFCDVFPKGVINIIYGEGKKMIPPLMATGKINVLGLIGTSKTANALKKQHPNPNRLRCVLGLEAKNPAIVLKGADLDLAVRECVLGCLSFNGQRCTALKILFVEASIADAFLERFAKAINALPFGMPWQEGVFVTPVAEKGKTDYLQELVSDAIIKGAKVVNADGATTLGSFFFPAVLYPVHHQMRVYHEEQFGPVIPVLSFDSISEPVEYMINSSYGQQVSIFGSDPDQIARLIDPLVNQVCRVNINSQCQRGPDTFPFTGRKDSAEGTLSVSDALRVFSIRTLVAAKKTGLNKQIITDIVRDHKSKFLATDFIL